MGRTLKKRYILVSDKRWHDELFDQLKKLPETSWLRFQTKDEFSFDEIAKFLPNYIFIPHWSYIIPANVYEAYTCIVFHMTDLPFGRGGSPLQNLITRGFEETVISAIKVEKGIDTGGIYLKKKLSLSGTAEDIFIRASSIIEKMILEIINENLLPVPQKGEPVIFKRRKPEESNISQLTESKDIYNYIRMLDCEGYPKAYLETEDFKFEFINADLKADNTITANVRIIKK